jgi:excisionase family DNA binding protein
MLNAPSHSELGKLIPVAEAAVRLGVHHKTIRRWIRDGHLTKHRMLGDVRTFVDVDEVAELRHRLDQREEQ